MNGKLISRSDFITTSIFLVITPILPVPLIAFEQEERNTITTSSNVLNMYDRIQYYGHYMFSI